MRFRVASRVGDVLRWRSGIGCGARAAAWLRAWGGAAASAEGPTQFCVSGRECLASPVICFWSALPVLSFASGRHDGATRDTATRPSPARAAAPLAARAAQGRRGAWSLLRLSGASLSKG